jgi:hypothetical protein
MAEISCRFSPAPSSIDGLLIVLEAHLLGVALPGRALYTYRLPFLNPESRARVTLPFNRIQPSARPPDFAVAIEGVLEIRRIRLRTETRGPSPSSP